MNVKLQKENFSMWRMEFKFSRSEWVVFRQGIKVEYLINFWLMLSLMVSTMNVHWGMRKGKVYVLSESPYYQQQQQVQNNVNR